MCGIFGWTLDKKAPLSAAQRETLASALAVANARRGPHSWGAYCLTRGADGKFGAPEIMKRVGSMADEKGIGALGLADVCMGHTRFATNGAVTVDNCHPFTVGDVTLAHNGMIYNHREVAAKYGRTCDVDSLHLAHHLAEGRPFNDLEGYGAVMYVRAQAPGEVHLSRMQSGQLSVYGLGSRGKCWGVVWSSDQYHLQAALKAARVDCFPYETLRQGRVYVARTAGDLVVLPDTIRHDLAAERLSREEQARAQWLTSGAQGSKPGDPVKHRKKKALTRRERREVKKRAMADAKATASNTADPKPGQITMRDIVEDDAGGVGGVYSSEDSLMERAFNDMDAWLGRRFSQED
jgi:hypothetical protein